MIVNQATGFRKAIIASTDCSIMEADFSGIEAVLVGYFSRDPNYIRLATLGVHAYVASHMMGSPADLSWDEQSLGKYFKSIKSQDKLLYDKAKHAVHGGNFGQTAYGLANLYPELYDRHSAQEFMDMYYKLCPRLGPWQQEVRLKAWQQGYLGGKDHPYNYRHQFFDVMSKDRNGKWQAGLDYKRGVAYYPQSTAAGIIREAALRLARPGPYYIGDCGPGGRSPFRGIIHDSILLEVLQERLGLVQERVYRAMTLPIKELPLDPSWGLQGSYLSIGVKIACGQNWADASEDNPQGMREVQAELGVASDLVIDEQEEELSA